jgi:hypothetical protein
LAGKNAPTAAAARDTHRQELLAHRAGGAHDAEVRAILGELGGHLQRRAARTRRGGTHAGAQARAARGVALAKAGGAGAGGVRAAAGPRRAALHGGGIGARKVLRGGRRAYRTNCVAPLPLTWQSLSA